MRVCVFTHTHIYIQKYLTTVAGKQPLKKMHKHVHFTRICTRICTFAQIYTYMYIHIYMHYVLSNTYTYKHLIADASNQYYTFNSTQ